MVKLVSVADIVMLMFVYTHPAGFLLAIPRPVTREVRATLVFSNFLSRYHFLS